MMNATTRYFDRIASEWTGNYERSGYYRQRLETVLAWVSQEPVGCTLLDFGCGSGVMMHALLTRGHTVTGVDASAEMIRSARRQLEDAYADRCRLEWLPASDGRGKYLESTYRGVICLGVLEYVHDAGELLDKLTRVIEPGGFLILSVPNRQSLFRRLETFIHHHPSPFTSIPFLKYLTRPDSYRSFQIRQFKHEQLTGVMAAAGLHYERVAYQVAPPPFQAVADHSVLGMNVVAKYRKSGTAENVVQERGGNHR